MRILFTAFVTVAAALLASSAAEARRTVVDFDPDTGAGHYQTVGGYCDFDGYECSPTALPYSVDLGNDMFTPSGGVLNYGDGALLFTDFSQYASVFPDAYYGLFITGGIDSTANRDAIGNFSFEQYTTLRMLGDGSMEMVAASCFSTSNCGGYRYVLRVTPEATGFAASVTYYDNEAYSYGYSITQLASDFHAVRNAAGQTFDFFVPATLIGFSPPPPPPVTPSVPEPATWMMMLGGFASAGIALRRRRRAGVPTLV